MDFHHKNNKIVNKSQDTSSDYDEKLNNDTITWKDLDLDDLLCSACLQLQWKTPTRIQREAIPPALRGRDVIGLSETGSGKTAAFILPILQTLIEHPQRYFALILTPTRELAQQIAKQVNSLGAGVGVSTVLLVGGMPKYDQAKRLIRKPHIIVATPGRLLDHLESTKCLDLRVLRFLVMDEADRLLNMNFEAEVDKILELIPQERRTMLFSATMTSKVDKLQRASLRDPVKIELSNKFQTVQTLKEYYIFVPFKHFEMYLVHVLNKISIESKVLKSFIVFCPTCEVTERLGLQLKFLGFSTVSLHGKMNQKQRLTGLGLFKSKDRNVLVSTDVVSRGLDIPHVDVVVNFGVPLRSKEYIHRVGRTARAGRFGMAITLVSQHDVEWYQELEKLLGKELELFETEKSEVMALKDRVIASRENAEKQLTKIREKEKKRKLGSLYGIEEDGDLPGTHQ